MGELNFQDDITYIDKNLYSIYSKYENSQEYPIITRLLWRRSPNY